ncbi:MAG: hypothetical protein V4727_13870 [Verrucomicrobiota bacterium]
MKTKIKSLIVVTGVFALMGVSQAEEAKEKEAKDKKAISPELLEKYDKDKDGKLSKEEKTQMKKAEKTGAKKKE